MLYAKTYRIEVLLLLLLLLLDWLRPVRHVPEINHHPKYFITVEGEAFPGSRVQFVMQYLTDPKLCGRKMGISGAISAYLYKKIYEPALGVDGAYRERIPIDIVRPGKCDWHPYGLTYSLLKKNEVVDLNAFLGVGFTGYMTKLNHFVAVGDYSCLARKHKKMMCLWKSGRFFNGLNNVFYRQGKLKLIVNFKKEK